MPHKGWTIDPHRFVNSGVTHLHILFPKIPAWPGPMLRGVKLSGRPTVMIHSPFSPTGTLFFPLCSGCSLPYFVLDDTQQKRPRNSIHVAETCGKSSGGYRGNQGIGAAIATHLAWREPRFVVNYASSRSGADRVVNEITSRGGKAVAVQGDMSKESDIKRLFEETKKSIRASGCARQQCWGLRVLPHRGGHGRAVPQDVHLNVLGVLLAIREAVKHFGPEGGMHHQYQLGGRHLELT